MLTRHVAMAVVLVALPLVGPAFTMYATSVEFRLFVVGQTAGGARREIPPASLAHAFPSSGRALLTGAEAFRRTTDVSVLRRHLDDVAKLACHEHPRFVEITVRLVERTSRGTTETTGRAACSR